MKIAVPTRNNKVDDHFGHCESYSIFSIEANTIQSVEMFPAPEGCGCKSDIAEVLQKKGVTVLLAGNMGAGALNVLQNEGITVLRGNSGDVRMVVEDYLQGKLSDSGVGCASHEAHHGQGGDGHVCNHGHESTSFSIDV